MPDIDLIDAASFDWWTDVSIRFSDQDPNLHVNNTAFAQYAEAGRVDYLNAMRRHLGIEPRSALASVQISYVNQLHYPGNVRVGTRLLRLGNKSYTLGQGLFAGDTVVATSEAVRLIGLLRQECLRRLRRNIFAMSLSQKLKSKKYPFKTII